MCYPWNFTGDKALFRSCRKDADCKALIKEKGGSSEDGTCFRHEDRREVFNGICLNKRFVFIMQFAFKYVFCQREFKTCSNHSDCDEDWRCIKGFCGDKQYFNELQSFSCEVNFFCEVCSQHADSVLTFVSLRTC